MINTIIKLAAFCGFAYVVDKIFPRDENEAIKSSKEDDDWYERYDEEREKMYEEFNEWIIKQDEERKRQNNN